MQEQLEIAKCGTSCSIAWGAKSIKCDSTPQNHIEHTKRVLIATNDTTSES